MNKYGDRLQVEYVYVMMLRRICVKDIRCILPARSPRIIFPPSTGFMK